MVNDYCVIFDMDGVIFDSERACLDTWTEAAAGYGLENIREVFNRCIGTNKNQTRQIVEDAYAATCGEGIADRLLSESSRLFHEKYDGGRLPIKDGVKEILEYLKSENVRCAVASSTRKAVVEAELRDAGLIDYFEEIVGGDSVKVSKPDPEIYLIACDKMKVKPATAFAIEDSYNGIRSAHAAGMKPIMVPDMISADDEMIELSEAVCEDLLKVIDYLKRKLIKPYIEFETERLNIRSSVEADKESGVALKAQINDAVGDEFEYGYLQDEWDTDFEDDRNICLSVFLKNDGTFVADAAFQNYQSPEVELAYGVLEAYRNQGIATEIVQGLIKKSHEIFKDKKVIIGANKDNFASRRVIEKCGGVLREYEDSLLSQRFALVYGEPGDKGYEYNSKGVRDIIEEGKNSVCIYEMP
ncbi:MAG: GNAT family N-acetyltransferase [Butyrivibrio sp.]|nr:GNAT family N-acetyltransferase [Butyrivibrio sp.]